MILSIAAPAAVQAAGHLRFDQLGLSPVIFSIGRFSLRWYSIAYIGGIVLGWWYLLRLLARPGAPMARRHADDLVFYVTLGIILGGRIGYVLFYGFDGGYFSNPLRILRLWDGGMSFHGGLVGVMLAMWLFARKEGLPLLRLYDYVACVAPIGQCFGRLANFVNGELWGKPSQVPWAIVFPNTVPAGLIEPARHPSQLYEALGEGVLLFLILAFLFYRTRARYQPGFLVGAGLAGFGAIRFVLEGFREPDAQFRGTIIEASGIHMGQWLCLPMVLIGAYLIATAPGRRQRVEPIAGSASVA
ncbi:prolipoprotein diacylglyceryl transferase [uncultured Sphingomonas sp.]|uniref:prolipoprotein diacylglyceryl transferase n=1 Tax=uncultured Sphingomonas sp. TaxID=158754 RepID=UPI0035CC7351